MLDQKEMYANDWTQFPSSAIVDDKEIITKKLNFWRACKIERYAAFADAIKRFKDNPKATMHLSGGMPTPVIEVCYLRRSALQEAINNVDIYSELHDTVGNGVTFDQVCSGDNILVPARPQEETAAEEAGVDGEVNGDGKSAGDENAPADEEAAG